MIYCGKCGSKVGVTGACKTCKKITKVAPTVAISTICSDMHCKRVGVVAQRVTDFWVTRCTEHMGKPIEIDFHKVGRA
jgi:hypothetical protein